MLYEVITIGKNNETSPEQQAKLEAEAKYTKKLDEGYFLTKDEALSEIVILPTLAHEYSDHSDKINWSKPVYVQPKLDGMRCLGNALGIRITSYNVCYTKLLRMGSLPSSTRTLW